MDEGAAPRDAPSGVDVDSIVRQLGVLGRFHRRVYPLVALAAMQVGLLHTTYIFLAGDVDYRYKMCSPLMTGAIRRLTIRESGVLQMNHDNAIIVTPVFTTTTTFFNRLIRKHRVCLCTHFSIYFIFNRL